VIRVDVEQRTKEWREARAGIVTASAFDRLLTPKTLKPSDQAEPYMNRLLAEWFLGRPLDDEDGDSDSWMKRGIVMEAEAWAWYAVEREVEVEEVGFCLRDDRLVGCSPDALVGDDGGLEVKVPRADVHVGYLRNPESLVAKYRGQVQGCLLVTGRAWFDLLSYNPAIPPVLVRVTPDPTYVEKLGPVLAAFVGRLRSERERLATLRDSYLAANPFA